LNIGILASEGSWYYRDLERTAFARGHACQRLEFERLVASVSPTGFRSGGREPPESALIAERTSDAYSGGSRAPLREDFAMPRLGFDLVLVRTMPPGSLEQVVYRMDVLGRLAAAGTRVINSPKSLECAVDKYLTTARLHEAGLPVPETIVCEHEDDALSAFEQLGGDVVVKPLFGAEGRGIVRVSDPDLAHRTFRTLMRLNAVLYLQRFIDHEGFDVRVLVLDGKPLGAIRRRSPNDFRTNVSRNAVAEPHEATPREIDFALRAASVTGAFIAGVDLLYDRAGNCYVIEVNAVPGWQAFAKVTGIDVADKLIAASR
jgi:RimK family alpha-L-glutamate ligase